APSEKVTPIPSKGSDRTQPNAVEGMTFTPMENALAGALSGMVKATIRRGTRLIDLFVINGDPVMAQRLAEAVGREYIRNAIERRATFSNDTLRYLVEEEERLKANLQKSEAAVAEYKERNPDALQLGGGTVATGSQAGSGSGAGGPRGGIVEDKLQDLSTKLTAAKTQPPILRNAIAQAKTTEANFETALHEQQGTAMALNRAAIGYQELARQAESDRALYESVLRQIKSTDLTKDIKTNAVSVAEH